MHRTLALLLSVTALAACASLSTTSGGAPDECGPLAGQALAWAGRASLDELGVIPGDDEKRLIWVARDRLIVSQGPADRRSLIETRVACWVQYGAGHLAPVPDDWQPPQGR